MSFRTLKLFETFLHKLRPGYDFTKKIHGLAIVNSESDPAKLLEDKYPFDPHFLKHSSKYLIHNYIFYEHYDADVFLRGYEKTPQSFMNYSENNAENVESSRDFDFGFHEDEKSFSDSLSVVSKHGTEASENDNRPPTFDRFLDGIKPKNGIVERKKQREFPQEYAEEPMIGKKIDKTQIKANLLNNVVPH